MNKYIVSNGTQFGYHTLIMADETALAQGGILATNEILLGLKNKTLCWSNGEIVPYVKTAEELAEEALQQERNIRKKYERLVEWLIRERYSLSDELKINREKNAGTDDGEFDVFNSYVEECKARARAEVYS